MTPPSWLISVWQDATTPSLFWDGGIGAGLALNQGSCRKQPGKIPLPDQVATEEQTEDEDEDGCAENHDVYVERQVLEPDVRHPETVMLEIRAHG